MRRQCNVTEGGRGQAWLPGDAGAKKMQTRERAEGLEDLPCATRANLRGRRKAVTTKRTQKVDERNWSETALGLGGVGVDGVQGTEGVDEGGAGVHGHGYAEGFGDFLLGGAGFESGVGVEGDAAVAASGDGNGDGDELAGFFAEERGFGVGGGEGLVALEGVGGEFGEFGDVGADLFLVVIPISIMWVSCLVRR